MPHLVIRVDGVIDHPKTAIDSTTRTFGQKDVQVLVFVDNNQPFVYSLATELVLRTKAIVSLAAEPNDAITLPFLFEQTRRSLIVSTIFRCVSAWNPVVFVGFKHISILL